MWVSSQFLSRRSGGKIFDGAGNDLIVGRYSWPCELDRNAFLLQSFPERLVLVIQHLYLANEELKTLLGSVRLGDKLIPVASDFGNCLMDTKDISEQRGRSGIVGYT